MRELINPRRKIFLSQNTDDREGKRGEKKKRSISGEGRETDRFRQKREVGKVGLEETYSWTNKASRGRTGGKS